MALRAKRYRDPKGCRVFFTDNFYTRHKLAISLKEITDGECRLVDTVKFSNVDSTNRYFLFKAIEQLKNSPRGLWLLVRAYNKDPNYEKMERQHMSANKKLPAEQRTPWVPPMEDIAENCGYIVFKDSKVVIFYLSDLASTTPKRPIMGQTEANAISSVQSLAKLQRWTGKERFHFTFFDVPAPIVAYNAHVHEWC